MQDLPDANAAARVGLMTAILSVSLSARQNVLEVWKVADLRERAVSVLPQGDDLRQAVVGFASRYPDLRRDAYALRLLGDELYCALNVALNPEAASGSRYRSDVDG